MTLVEEAKNDGKPLSIGLIANAADVFPELVLRGSCGRGDRSDSAHESALLHSPWHAAGRRRRPALAEPEEFTRRSMESMARHVQAMLDFRKRGSIVFDYGNNCAKRAYDAGVKEAFSYPGFVPAFIRPLFCEGKGPFRWGGVNGDEQDLLRTDEADPGTLPENKSLERWIRMAQQRVAFQGLPGAHLLAGLRRAREGRLEVQRTRREGRSLCADRDRTRPSGFGDRSLRHAAKTEGMRDGSDAISDWPILNALIQRGGRRDVGQFPSRRRRGHRLQPARGTGYRADGTPAAGAASRARADDRSGHGRRPPRRCGLSRGDQVRKENGIKIPMMK